jgi:hypothetical protein
MLNILQIATPCYGIGLFFLVVFIEIFLLYLSLHASIAFVGQVADKTARVYKSNKFETNWTLHVVGKAV